MSLCCQISDARFLEGWNLALRAARIIAPLRSAVDFHPFLFLELHFPRPPPRAIQGRERDENPLNDPDAGNEWDIKELNSTAEQVDV